MARPPLTDPPTTHPVLRCSIQESGCIKFNGDGSGKIILTFDRSETDVATELIKHYRETELHVTFIKVDT